MKMAIVALSVFGIGIIMATASTDAEADGYQMYPDGNFGPEY